MAGPYQHFAYDGLPQFARGYGAPLGEELAAGAGGSSAAFGHTSAANEAAPLFGDSSAGGHVGGHSLLRQGESSAAGGPATASRGGSSFGGPVNGLRGGGPGGGGSGSGNGARGSLAGSADAGGVVASSLEALVGSPEFVPHGVPQRVAAGGGGSLGLGATGSSGASRLNGSGAAPQGGVSAAGANGPFSDPLGLASLSDDLARLHVGTSGSGGLGDTPRQSPHAGGASGGVASSHFTHANGGGAGGPGTDARRTAARPPPASYDAYRGAFTT
jgi:hypothetical protein